MNGSDSSNIDSRPGSPRLPVSKSSSLVINPNPSVESLAPTEVEPPKRSSCKRQRSDDEDTYEVVDAKTGATHYVYTFSDTEDEEEISDGDIDEGGENDYSDDYDYQEYYSNERNQTDTTAKTTEKSSKYLPAVNFLKNLFSFDFDLVYVHIFLLLSAIFMLGFCVGVISQPTKIVYVPVENLSNVTSASFGKSGNNTYFGVCTGDGGPCCFDSEMLKGEDRASKVSQCVRHVLNL
ncbi:hypothetical protein H072_494 [Dactylellina haptotyla CBS 200.50]|uniref:Uncharacterized protein n=1 Tax=Dactylellina haptotyla (strain CBS 200.50) TaxID=1284197 RepID=S8CCW7_DACHA|nr:hypothetical protein H072_494 [Dactylellina haptotyla CBS 200.50]